MRINYWIILVLSSFQIKAQDTKYGNWLMYFGNQQINEYWNIHNEIQYRNYNYVGDLEQLMFRGGLGYNLSENNNNILIGFAYVISEPYIEGTKNEKITEKRLFQQFITKQSFNNIVLQHRYRVEQRFIEDEYNARFRYLIGIQVPLSGFEVRDRPFYLSFYNELFVKTTPENMFDRNRVYGALGYSVFKHIRIEAGVMSQILQDNSRKQFQIAVYNNLPF